MIDIRKNRVYIVLGVVFVLAGTLYARDTIWHQDMEEARKTALDTEKDILLYFSQFDKNPECQRLETEVLQTESFIKEAPRKFVLVQMDFSTSAEIPDPVKEQKERMRAEFTRKYGLSGYPTIYLMNPQGEVYAQTGYQEGGVKAYLDHLTLLSMTKPMIDPGSQWIEYIEIAMAKADYHKRDLLMLFTGSDWCPACLMLEREILSTSVFQEGVAKDFVLLKLNFPRSQSQPETLKRQNQYIQEVFSRRFQFQGYPTIYLADAQGNPYGKVGYSRISPQEFTDGLRDIKAQREKGGNESKEGGEKEQAGQ